MKIVKIPYTNSLILLRTTEKNNSQSSYIMAIT